MAGSITLRRHVEVIDDRILSVKGREPTLRSTNHRSTITSWAKDYGMKEWITGPSFGVRVSFTRKRDSYIKPCFIQKQLFLFISYRVILSKRKIYERQNIERILASINIYQSDLQTFQTACVIHNTQLESFHLTRIIINS